MTWGRGRWAVSQNVPRATLPVYTPPLSDPPALIFFPEGRGVCTQVKSDQHQFFPLDISP